MANFTNRESQYPNRRRLIPVTGLSNVYDIERYEGEVYTEGTLISADELNTVIGAAETAASQAITVAQTANNNSANAVTAANGAVAKVIALEEEIVTGQGSAVKVNGVLRAEVNLSTVAESGNYHDLSNRLIRTSPGNRWGVTPHIEGDGTMEIGKYIDFHLSGSDTSDNGVRITADLGRISVDGLIEAESFNAYSDIRKKENISPADENIFTKLLDLKLYNYNYIDDAKKKTYLGIIAQDAEKVFGDDAGLMIEKDSEGYLLIKESKLVYMLLGILKLQEKRICALEADGQNKDRNL